MPPKTPPHYRHDHHEAGQGDAGHAVDHAHPHGHREPPRTYFWRWVLLGAALVALAAIVFFGVRTLMPKPAQARKTIGAVGVYFPSGESYSKVYRPVYEGQTPVEAAMAGLMAGPTQKETAEGLTTYIPEGTTLKSVTLDPAQYGTVRAIVAVDGTFLDSTSRDPGDAELEYRSRLDQVGYTMNQFKTVSDTEVKVGARTLQVPAKYKVDEPTTPAPKVVAPPIESMVPERAAVAPKKSFESSITAVQTRLAQLKFLPSDAITGKKDYRTKQAVMAFQAWQGLGRDGDPGPKTVAALDKASAPTPRATGTSGREAQVYREKGVVLFVNGGQLVRAVHVSTGKPGYTTPAGSYRVYQKELKHWSNLYHVWLPYASFFYQGYAFHEYDDVPPYPASHGCCRTPAPEAPWVYEFLKKGTPVQVY